MKHLSLNLTKFIFNLELKKDMVFDNTSQKYQLCHCKSIILEKYIDSIELLHIKVTSLLMKFFENRNIEKTIEYFEGYKLWFEKNVYDDLFRLKNISHKMVLLFQLIQMNIDNNFFNKFKIVLEEELKNFNNCNKKIDCESEEIENLISYLFNIMSNWAELCIFSIMSISRINCKSIDDKILSDFKVKNNNFCLDDCLKKYNKTEIEEFIFNNLTTYKKFFSRECCYLHKIINERGEILQIIPVIEMYQNKGEWIDTFLNVLKKYHKNCKNITVIINYKLIDEENKLIFDENNFNRIKLATRTFKDVFIINYKNVDFGNYKEALNNFFSNKEQIKNIF